VLDQFPRSDLASSDAGTTLAVECGSDPAGWTVAQDGVNGIVISAADDSVPAGIDLVTVTIPRAPAMDDKLFVRLKVTIAP
jgi:hypothetical protein